MSLFWVGYIRELIIILVLCASAFQATPALAEGFCAEEVGESELIEQEKRFPVPRRGTKLSPETSKKLMRYHRLIDQMRTLIFKRNKAFLKKMMIETQAQIASLPVPMQEHDRHKTLYNDLVLEIHELEEKRRALDEELTEEVGVHSIVQSLHPMNVNHLNALACISQIHQGEQTILAAKPPQGVPQKKTWSGLRQRISRAWARFLGFFTSCLSGNAAT